MVNSFCSFLISNGWHSQENLSESCLHHTSTAFHDPDSPKSNGSDFKLVNPEGDAAILQSCGYDSPSVKGYVGNFIFIVIHLIVTFKLSRVDFEE